MVSRGDIRRLDYGHFLRPAEETGTGRPRVEAALGYLVRHPNGLLLFDTGIGEADPETEARYPTTRRPLPAVLRAAGVDLEDVQWVMNCHLHVDHCGGNRMFPGRPIITQRVELAAAHQPDYTVTELVDFPGATYEQLDGEAELFSEVWVLPTPGHTDGHQSLVVRCADGTVVLAGQAHHLASDYAADQLAWRARCEAAYHPSPPYPAWIDRLQQFDPARIMFAHDLSVWEPTSPR
jgi:N-acyl homoserine lactone hydrolase